MAKLELGLMVGIGSDPLSSFQKVADLGIPTCQLSGGGEALMEGKYPSAEMMAAEAEKAGGADQLRVSHVGGPEVRQRQRPGHHGGSCRPTCASRA